MTVEPGFPPPTPLRPLVSTQWLADHLGSERLVVVDASVVMTDRPGRPPAFVTGHDRYLVEGHIPGAVFADLLDAFSDPEGRFGFTRPDAARFEAAASALGIGDDSTVVVYDGAIGTWAARLWWLLRSFGHERVAVLDGGYRAWLAEGRPTELGHVEPAGGIRFTARPREELWASKAEVEDVVAGRARASLVCAVPEPEFAGAVLARSRAGHIPGSISVPAASLLARETRTFLGEDALRERFAGTDGDRVIVYCGGGIAATADALALTLLGHDDVAVFDGSLNEWAADPEAPLVTLDSR